ncbi:hypothetical protein EV191_101256 [Tamaricihabitans halophyticus]|uniref:Uncharacterized protein n=1 Tax=Tamaricihabitans halophyticus TaxID=1262583 RepID=A0A4R2RA76_9PSEU|nr:hypothetical protein [Tamaricihabitans halophyticus]TCP56315.1 hypothetical protein EV191_101256 [Tamaricihabitans halophyticus]
MALGGPELAKRGLQHRLLSTRASAVLPMLGAVISATALAGVAVFTVAQAGCDDGGQYVYHDNKVELVGSCLDENKLPGNHLPTHPRHSGPDDPSEFRP